MKLAGVSTVMGYGMSILMGLVGILVLAGVLATEGTPVPYRVIFGIVLVLYSVYRFIMTRARSRQALESQEGSEE